MALAQQGGDLLLRGVGCAGAYRTYNTGLDIKDSALEFLLDGRIRNHDGVILVPAPRIESFLVQNA